MWPLSYLGAAYIWRIFGHVQFDLVLRKTHFRTHHILQATSALLILIFGSIAAWLAWESFLFQYHSQAATQNLRYPYWPVYWTASVGISLLALELLFSLLRHIREIIKPTGAEEAIYGVYKEVGPRVPTT